jgi:hypothetical protein
MQPHVFIRGFILEIPPSLGKYISQCHLGEKWEGGTEKDGKCKRKRKKGKEKFIIGSKSVKLMQNKET